MVAAPVHGCLEILLKTQRQAVPHQEGRGVCCRFQHGTWRRSLRAWRRTTQRQNEITLHADGGHAKPADLSVALEGPLAIKTPLPWVDSGARGCNGTPRLDQIGRGHRVGH